MTRHLILSNQQLISMIERLGYLPRLKEEVIYRCGPDQIVVPILISTLIIKLPDHQFFPPATETFLTDMGNYLN